MARWRWRSGGNNMRRARVEGGDGGAAAAGYRKGLVDLAKGQISREIFVNEAIYARGAGAAVCPRLAVCRPRKPDPQPRRFLCLGHGRGIGDPVPRPRRRDPCVPEFVPPSRHEGVPLRRGQHAGLHLPLSRLELRHRRQAGRRAVFPRGLSLDSSTARNGVWSRSRNCATTRGRSWPPGTRRRRPLPNISASSRAIST